MASSVKFSLTVYTILGPWALIARERERETVKWGRGRGQSGVQSGQDLFVTRQELFIKKSFRA